MNTYKVHLFDLNEDRYEECSECYILHAYASLKNVSIYTKTRYGWRRLLVRLDGEKQQGLGLLPYPEIILN